MRISDWSSDVCSSDLHSAGVNLVADGHMAAMTDTLAAPAGFTIEVKHSRFLAQAAAVDSPASALAFMAGVSDPAATTTCWAWRLDDQYRSHDRGDTPRTARHTRLV